MSFIWFKWESIECLIYLDSVRGNRIKKGKKNLWGLFYTKIRVYGNYS